MSNSVTVRTNSLFGKGTRDLPKFQAGPRYIEVYHREYIKDIVGSATGSGGAEGDAPPSVFDIESFDINPGLPPTEGSATVNGLFPWLSTIASQFETYQFMGLALEFVSTCGEMNSTSGGLGTVVQVVEYNALNPVFQNKESMMNYDAAVSAKPTVSALCGVECSPNDLPSTHLYVRSAPVPANADARLYDIGNYQIATQSLPQLTMPVGELWVTYHVRLYQPKLAVSNVVPPVVSSDGLWAYSQITSVLASPAPGATPDYSIYNTRYCTTAAQDMMFGDANYGWAVGGQQNDEQDESQLRIEFLPSGFSLASGATPSVNCIWRLCGSSITPGRVVEVQLVWSCGLNPAITTVPSLTPALSQGFTAPTASVISCNTLGATYPLEGTNYSFGFVTRWVFQIQESVIRIDPDSGISYVPIVLHDSTNGTQSYRGCGTWGSSLSLAVNMYASDGGEAGPLSFPYDGPPVIDAT